MIWSKYFFSVEVFILDTFIEIINSTRRKRVCNWPTVGSQVLIRILPARHLFISAINFNQSLWFWEFLLLLLLLKLFLNSIVLDLNNNKNNQIDPWVSLLGISLSLSIYLYIYLFKSNNFDRKMTGCSTWIAQKSSDGVHFDFCFSILFKQKINMPNSFKLKIELNSE